MTSTTRDRAGAAAGWAWGTALCLLLLFGASQLFASSDIGYVVRKDRFSLTVRFGFAELDEVPKGEAEELANAGSLLFECIRWVHANGDALGRTRADVTVFWDLPGRQFAVQVNDDLKAQDVPYRMGQAHAVLFRELARLLQTPGLKTAGPDTVPLTVIRSKEYVDKQFERSDVFFGAIPGYMYSSREKRYIVILWSPLRQADWVRSLRKAGASVEEANVGRTYLADLLGSVE